MAPYSPRKFADFRRRDMELPTSQGYQSAVKRARDPRIPRLDNTETPLDLQQSIFELIDTRSFSNMWYWISLAVVWSSAAHYGLGVPYDLVQRARRKGGQAQIDLEDMVRINCNRMLFIGSISGLWIIGIVCFLLTGLGLMGFLYRVELAQAVFLIAFPLAIVGGMSLSMARLIVDDGLVGEDLQKRLLRHRLLVQVIGVISIFVTAMWGMYQNIRLGGFFG